ncbi:NitT/TauT family transport system permease protein [Streptosporangium subroseum]|uniref:NitT/TauT family transport system permease protein n=1 Tax=Streptosporangium subroseum TaxID=106412 RepID=A0A239P1A7_9ACTN|nr:ABC transporter permease [Streptosporangium subroseum]SNT60782.1 NitT/TauT family transport system permease protein [Streptosporangium subroseum]
MASTPTSAPTVSAPADAPAVAPTASPVRFSADAPAGPSAAFPARPSTDASTASPAGAPVAGAPSAPIPAVLREAVAEASESSLTGPSVGRRLWRGSVRVAGSVGRRTVAVAALAAIWEILPRLEVVDPTFLTPLSGVLAAWWDLLLSGELLDHTQASLIRSLSGLALAIIVAIPLGLLIGWYRPVADLLNPVLELFRNTAALALLPVFVLILGLGETSKISIILYACAWPILLNTIAGVKGVDPLLIKSARSMGLPPIRLFQKVILPAAVPTIFTGIRMAGAYSILVLVAAEMVGAKAGLGYLINYAQFNFRVPDMYAGIITISVLGLLFNQFLVRLERRFSTWRTT